MEKIVKLRPHHLLCTQGYSGKGYSEDFVRNMNEITDYLRNHKEAKVQIVTGTDDICVPCPNRDKDTCKDDHKVKNFDKKMINYFHLKNGIYTYQDIVREINSQMTPTMMNDICKECSWYPISRCKKVILKISE